MIGILPADEAHCACRHWSLYALADPSDQYHKRSVTDVAALEKRGFSVTVAYPILCEAYTLVLYRLGGAYAREWLAEVLAGAALVNAEPADVILGATHLERFEDHPITLAMPFWER